MKLAILIAAAAIAVPLGAPAEILQARPVEARPYISNHLLVCNDRSDELWHRKALFDEDKRDVDREGDRLARAKQQLALRFTGLDPADVKEVEDYNQESAEINRQVAAYNRRVAELNGAASLLNADSAEMMAYCNGLYVASR